MEAVSSVVRKSNCSDFQALLLAEFLGGGGGGGFPEEVVDCGGGKLLDCVNSDDAKSDPDKNESVVSAPLIDEIATNATVPLATDDKKAEEDTSCDNTIAISALNVVEIDDKVVVTVTDPKVKYNLNKEPIVKLERLPGWVLEKKTVRVSIDNKIYFREDDDDEDEFSTTSDSEEEDEEENGKALYEAPPPPINFLVHPLMFSHHNNRSNALYSNPQRFQWAASFFLHLNRYQPEEELDTFIPPANTFPPPKLASTTSNSKSHSRRQPLKQRTSPSSLSSHRQQHRRTNNNARSTAPPKKRRYRKRGDPANHPRGKGSWTCPYANCDKIFLYKWNMETHLMLHTGEKPYPCHLCDNRFQQRSQLIKHYVGQHPYSSDADATQDEKLESPPPPPPRPGVGLNPSFSCGFCGDSFKKGKAYLEKHILDEHKDKLVRKVQKRRGLS